MTRLFVAVATCAFISFAAGGAVSAAPVSEATVEKACGDRIEGGCAGSQCATGCEKTEGGKLVSYGCTFPNKPGATKATCTRTVFRKGQSRNGNRTTGAGSPSVLRAD